MKIKPGASLNGLHPVMRQVLREAEKIWSSLGRAHDGVTVTSGTDGAHSAASWHPYGFALDFRTGYSRFGEGEDLDTEKAESMLKEALPDFDVVIHKTHIHVEIGNGLAEKLGVMY